MKTIGLIPLDSRPCNTLWLEQLSNLAGYKLLMYPRSKCGDLFKGANFYEQLEWLKENVKSFDYLIISCDGLTSGGLVQARTGAANLEAILKNKYFINELKKENPRLKIYLFDTLMRTSITTKSLDTAKYWALMNEFSRLSGLVYFTNQEEYKVKLEEVKSQVPKEIIEEYLEARRKKNVLNKYFIDLVKENIVDYLIILQEDSMPNGIQKIEQIELINIINDNKLDNKIKFYNGTDEGALVLFAKIILEDNRLNPNIYLHLPYENALDKTMLFEDRPFINNLKLMFETINLNFSSYESSDFVLSIYTEEENVDLQLDNRVEVKPTADLTYKNYINELNQFINGKDVCFVDLLFPNGGSPDIVKNLDTSKLTCYSAWNTASNAVGSALAHMVSVIVAKHKGLDYKKLSDNFTKERILDDCIYQYIARRIVNEKYLKKNVNIYNLGEFETEVLYEIIKEMKISVPEFLGDVKYSVTLPWKRTFEAEILILGD